jgi:muramoyltetrapeptide carboxypeptidase
VSRATIKPPPLRPGGTIGVFTPSTPAHLAFRDKYLHGFAGLRGLGFHVIEGPLTAAATAEGYRAGPPRARAAELMALWLDPRVDALVSTIGGMNSSSLIPYLDFAAMRARPKLLCGYSDVTSLHCAILTLAGVRTFYGPAVVPSFGEWPAPLPETAGSFLDAAQRHTRGRRRVAPPPRFSDRVGDARTEAWRTEPRAFRDNPGWRALVPGRVTAEVVVLGLNALAAAAGTPYFPDLAGRVLIAENMDGSMAREERTLRQLERMGVFDRIAGLVFGKFERFDPMGAPFTHDELLREVLGPRPYPVVTNFDCGHTAPMLTLAQHTRVTLDARGGYDVELVVEEPMVASA